MKKRIFISIFSFFAFLFACLGCVKVFAYDNGFVISNDYINSLNLFNINQTLNNNGINLKYTNSKYIINGTNTINENIGLPTYISLNSGTYTISTQNVSGTFSSDFRFVLHDLNWTWQYTIYFNRESSATFTIDISTNITFDVYGPNANNTINCSGYIMLNEGNTPLNYFPYGSYLNVNSIDVETYKPYGMFSYMDNGFTRFWQDLSINDIIPYLTNNSILFYDIINQNNVNYSANDLYVSFTRLPVEMLNMYWYSDSLMPYEIRISFDNNSYVFTPNSNIMYDLNYFTTTYSDFDSVYVEDINWFFSSPDSTSPMYYDNGYSLGYSSGYSNGSIYGYDKGYDNGYTSGYNNAFESQQVIINTLRNEYNDLLDLYNDYLNGDVSFTTLVWQIATIPFESFKQIWNVDLLGLNLGEFAIALMFVGVVLYLWKKFI